MHNIRNSEDKQMKIEELNQNAVISHVASSRIDKPEQVDAHGEAAGKKQEAAVKVDLSSYMPVVPSSQKQQDDRVSRLEELKAQINNGAYKVPTSAVAEKMLSKIFGATVH